MTSRVRRGEEEGEGEEGANNNNTNRYQIEAWAIDDPKHSCAFVREGDESRVPMGSLSMHGSTLAVLHNARSVRVYTITITTTTDNNSSSPNNRAITLARQYNFPRPASSTLTADTATQTAISDEWVALHTRHDGVFVWSRATGEVMHALPPFPMPAAQYTVVRLYGSRLVYTEPAGVVVRELISAAETDTTITTTPTDTTTTDSATTNSATTDTTTTNETNTNNNTNGSIANSTAGKVIRISRTGVKDLDLVGSDGNTLAIALHGVPDALANPSTTNTNATTSSRSAQQQQPSSSPPIRVRYMCSAYDISGDNPRWLGDHTTLCPSAPTPTGAILQLLISSGVVLTFDISGTEALHLLDLNTLQRAALTTTDLGVEPRWMRTLVHSGRLLLVGAYRNPKKPEGLGTGFRYLYTH